MQSDRKTVSLCELPKTFVLCDNANLTVYINPAFARNHGEMGKQHAYEIAQSRELINKGDLG